MNLRHTVFLVLILDLFSFGQTYTISTFAGGTGGLPINTLGTNASFGLSVPNNVAADGAGNLFFAVQNSVLRYDAITHMLTLVAGSGASGWGGDGGPAVNAQLNSPIGLVVSEAGDLYIADSGNDRIRKVSNGSITTVAGNGIRGFSGDGGPAAAAQFYAPADVAVDGAGNLYIADQGNIRVREVSGGVIRTVAGNGTRGFSGDNGPATTAQLGAPRSVAVDAAGNLYISDEWDNRIRKVSNGVITTVAGNGTTGFSGDNGPATNAQLTLPVGIAVDASGTLYIADSDNFRVRKVTDGVITTVAGGGKVLVDGPATSVAVGTPQDVTLDNAGSLYIAENGRIRKLSGGMLTTVVGGGSQIGDNGPATNAALNEPIGVALDPAGNLLIAERFGGRVREVSNGMITTFAGGGTAGLTDHVPATSAGLVYPEGVAVGPGGDVYLSDVGTLDIRKVVNGMIATVAGTGQCCYGGDNGPAMHAVFSSPTGVAVDSAGALYIADNGNHRIRKLAGGIITTVAGNGTAGFSGDNGPATQAQLNVPWGVAVDSAGNLYIADTVNNRVRMVANGIISTVAGTGAAASWGDGGPSVNASLDFPMGVAVDSGGSLYIADSSNYRVRKISKGVITTIGGNGTRGFSGDGGPATNAQMVPSGLTVGPAGEVYVSDVGSVRLLMPTPAINPGGVLNAASSTIGGPVAPGSIATVYGGFLLTSLSTAGGLPLSTILGGLSLYFGSGQAAPLFAVSGSQINFQVPWELAGRTQASISASINNQSSTAEVVKLAPFAPGVFSMDSRGSGQGAVLDSSYHLVDASNPAIAGTTVIQIYCTGLGAVTNQPPTGAAAASEPLSYTTTIPTVTIGGAPALVRYSGLVPGVVGEYQVNTLVPSTSAKGSSVPVVISIGGVSSNTVTIAVQ